MHDADSGVTLAIALADFETSPSLRVLKDRIERFEISADAKSLLLDVAELTFHVGGKVVAFGRKILAFVIDLATRFQNVLFGIMIALVLSVVLASVPLLGPAIAAILTPLMLAFGIGRRALEDFRNSAVQGEIEQLRQRVAILSAHAVA